MTAKDAVEHQAVYAGQRDIQGGKVAQVWEIDGKEMYFGKAFAGVVGGIYVVEMTPDLTQMYTTRPRYTMNRIDDDVKIAAWDIKHRTSVRNRKRAAAERKHRANGILDDATWSLDRIVKGLKNVDEVYALNEILASHLLDVYWRSRG